MLFTDSTGLHPVDVNIVWIMKFKRRYIHVIFIHFVFQYWWELQYIHFLLLLTVLIVHTKQQIKCGRPLWTSVCGTAGTLGTPDDIKELLQLLPCKCSLCTPPSSTEGSFFFLAFYLALWSPHLLQDYFSLQWQISGWELDLVTFGSFTASCSGRTLESWEQHNFPNLKWHQVYFHKVKWMHPFLIIRYLKPVK